jgi:hypothetical protein
MFNVIHPEYRSESALRPLREEFRRAGYVKLPGLLDVDALAFFGRLADRLGRSATRRSFVMPGVETPRRMSTIGGRRIAEEEPLLATLYSHDEVVSLVRSVVGTEVHRCQHDHEFMVANFMTEHGDSHGWHVDDPAYALVVVLDAPPLERGGCLEFIAHWQIICKAWGEPSDRDVGRLVARAREQGHIEVRHHARGDGYLLTASTSLHRVTPIVGPAARRAVLNMAYQDVACQSYGHTATVLYGEGEVQMDGRDPCVGEDRRILWRNDAR